MLVATCLVTPARAATPGPLAVPLTVHEDAGFARTAEIATAGVPLPKSAAIADAKTLRVLAVGGQEIASQMRVLSRWDAPVSDESAAIRWVLVSFPVTLPKNGEVRVTLQAGDAAAGGATNLATQNDAVVSIDTGAFTTRFEAADPGPLRFAGEKRAREVRLVENGPLRAQVIVSGELAEGFSEENGGTHPLLWTERWDFQRGIPGADVTLTIENPDRPFEHPYNDRGAPRGKRFRTLAVAWRGAAPAGAKVRGGTTAAGWVAAGPALLGVRKLKENGPSAIAASGGNLVFSLFAQSASGTFFQGSRAKTWEIFLRHAKEPPASAAARASHPPRVTVDPAWLQSSEALGPMSIAEPSRWPAFEATAAAVTATGPASLEAERAFEGAYGWLDYGDTMRAGTKTERLFGNNEFDFGGVMLRQYLRDPKHRVADLDAAHDMLRHLADIDVMHTDDDNSWANRGVHKHDEGRDREHVHGPDFSHFWVRGLLSYWLATGDERSHDVAVNEIGRWIAQRENPAAPGTWQWADELRDAGWALIAMTDLYEATGEPENFSRARRMVHAMILPNIGKDGSMREADFVENKAWFAPWQQAYIADGLGRYCQIARRRGAADIEAESGLRQMLDFLASDAAWVKGPLSIYGRAYPESIAFGIVGAKKTADEASMTQALADPFVWGWRLFGEARYATQAERAMKNLFPSGPEIFFDRSIHTPAKSSAVRLYFGDAERWMEQTRTHEHAAATQH